MRRLHRASGWPADPLLHHHHIFASATPRSRHWPALGRPEKPHPLQTAYIEEQVPQCGYCINGWIMTAAAFLRDKKKPTEAEIKDALSGLKCRCGTHISILKAVKRAAEMMG